MELMLAVGLYLGLGVTALALGWAWLAPRLPRRVRLAVLTLAGTLAVLALVVSAQVPHDYRPEDLPEALRGLLALVLELLIALVGGTAALLAVGRRRTQTAALCAAGVYLAGVGLALYTLLGGEPTVQGPLLLLVGTAIAGAAATHLAGAPRWLAVAIGLALGPLAAQAGETLRGPGNPGGGPAAAPRDVVLLVGIAVILLLLGGVWFGRRQGRVLVEPFGRAAAGWLGTTLVLLLRGRGEWAPGPDAPSTTLYGLPLTLLAVAISLLILERPVSATARRGTSARGRRLVGRISVRPVVGVLLLIGGLGLAWHPAPETCAAGPDPRVSSAAAAGTPWARAPGSGAPRGAPGIPAFDAECAHRTLGLSQLVYVLYSACKWPNVDPAYPLVQASGTLRHIGLSNEDSPWLHSSHDLGLDLVADPEAAWLVLAGGAGGGLLHAETESGGVPLADRPVAGDRVTIAGRWIFDCGHDPKTEIHPAAVIAVEHDEWRADAAGGPQSVRVVRVWMNSRPGPVAVPLAPFDLPVAFPVPPADPRATPLVQVVSGTPDAVSWTIGAGPGPRPAAALHIEPPARAVTATFEVLLGYRPAAPAPRPPAAYTFTFDRLIVRDDLRRVARNTTGLPDLHYPALGLPAGGHWYLEAIVGRTWRTLLTDAAVTSGHDYSLAAVPPVHIVTGDAAPLTLAITGYVENDPSAGVGLASGDVGGADVLRWDLGPPASLCCGQEQTFVPPHGAWALSYHVERAAP